MQLRSIISLFALLVFLTVATGGGVYFHSVGEALRNDILGDADDDVQDFAKRIAISLSENQKISAAVAGLKELPAALIMKNPGTIRQANAILDHFQSSIQADVCYLIDHTGDTISSSNRNTPENFVGKNYAFRPYFQNAISGTPAVYPALGVVTKKRGLFYSHPVYGGGRKQPLGVLVIKSSTDPIEKEMYMRHEGIMLLIDPHGIVFISNTPEWLYHSLWSIPREELSAVMATQQFGKGPIEWIGMERKDAHDAIDNKGKKYIIYQKEIANLPGWTASYLLDSEILSQETSVRLFRKFGPFIVAFCIVIGLAALFLYRKAGQEIHRRKLADEDQKKSLSLLQATLESTADGILVVNSAREIVSFNTHFAEMWHLPEDILSSKDDRGALRFVLDQLSDPQGFLDKVEALYAHPREESFDVLEFQDGRIVERYSRPQRMRDRIVGRVWSFRDITDRKRAEEALQLTRFTVDNVADAVYWMDAKAQIVDVNETACSMLGYTREELLNLTVFDIDPDFTADKWADGWEALKSQGKRRIETKHRTKDGRSIPVEIMANYLSFGGKELDCAFARDISQRKQAEEDLLKTQKLESLGLLAGGIAHDFNNTLTAILGNISLVRMKMKPDELQFEWLVEAERASYHAKELTQQLLTFAKGGAPVKSTVLLEQLIRDSVGFAMRGSNVRCDFSFTDGLWPIDIDRGQMGQVFNNLVINACQAMPGGGIIKIHAKNIDIGSKDGLPLPEGKYVKISIEDQGTGIPEEHLQRIFDPYFTTKQKGSGLGLSIVYSVIRNHNGHITVKSQHGVGTTFTIYLPASAEKVVEKKSEGEECIVGKGRVLLMDDDEMVRKVAGEILKRMGYEVEFAPDGAEAIRLYKTAMASSHPFDAVIMDLTVPGGMGGKEAIQKLHEVDPGVKAIVSSGYSQDPVMANYREYGFCEVIAKPFSNIELGRLMRKVIAEP